MFMDGLGLGAILADDMGLGKTVQVLAMLERERAEAGRRRLQPTLLICPMSLVANWQREAERFAPKLRVHVHHGSERLTGPEFHGAAHGVHLVVTTYALALRDRDQLAEVGWRRIVLDEAQAIKNAATKQARAVRSLSAPRRIALTGTPVENRLADLWSLMEFANPGLLGTAEQFKDRFARPIERGNEGAEAAAARLRQATSSFILRRVKTDPAIISDLPEKVEMKVVCNLTREQASLYQSTVDQMLAAIGDSDAKDSGPKGIGRNGMVLAMLTRLKQICDHPALFLKDGSRLPGRSGKLARVEDLCDEVLAAGEKALLFTQYAEFGAMLQAHLSERFGRPVSFLHGGVSKPARDAMVRGFEEADGPPLFVLSLKAGGVGLNLTAANHVVHVDRWWNPAVENQATDRAFRIGQRKNVQVRKLMCAGTLEERIDRVIEDKRGLAERIVGTGEGWLTELSVGQLRDLVLLSDDAVSE
jgi:non-specific serine/threonine protein kinase